MAGLVLLPGLAGVSTALLFFADFPTAAGRPVAIGTTIGVVLWVALSLFSLGDLGDPRHARSGIYGDVSSRLLTVQAQLGALEPETPRAAGARAGERACEPRVRRAR